MHGPCKAVHWGLRTSPCVQQHIPPSTAHVGTEGDQLAPKPFPTYDPPDARACHSPLTRTHLDLIHAVGPQAVVHVAHQALDEVLCSRGDLRWATPSAGGRGLRACVAQCARTPMCAHATRGRAWAARVRGAVCAHATRGRVRAVRVHGTAR